MIELKTFPLISTRLTLRLMKNNVDEDFLNYDNKRYDDDFAYDIESFQSRCSHYTTVLWIFNSCLDQFQSNILRKQYLFYSWQILFVLKIFYKISTYPVK